MVRVCFHEGLERIGRNDPTLTTADMSLMYDLENNYKVEIADALSYNTNLLSMKLVNCDLQVYGAALLADVLARNTTLKIANLSENLLRLYSKHSKLSF